MNVYVKWETDGLTLEECGLKAIVTIPSDIEDIADYLSDEDGFLVESFEIL